MTQRSDAPALEVPGYWLGDPSSGIRWWWDATFRAWLTFGALFVVGSLLLWWALPALVVPLLLAIPASRLLTQHLPERYARPHLFAAGLVALAVLVVPTSAWFFPLPLVLAMVASVPLGIVATRVLMKIFDRNRPVAYWIELGHRIATGPRRQRPTLTFRPVERHGEDVGLTEIDRAALAADPKGAPVHLFRRKVPIVSAMQWTPNDVEHAGQMINWLSSINVPFKIDRDKWLIVDLDDALLVKPGHWLIRHQGGDFEVLSDRALRRAYDEVGGE